MKPGQQRASLTPTIAEQNDATEEQYEPGSLLRWLGAAAAAAPLRLLRRE